MFVDTATGYPHVLSGKLRALGVASPKRVAGFDAPTLDEQGIKGFEAYAWQGLVAPTGTPPEVITTLNKALVAALGTAAVKERFQTLGLEPLPSTPQQMGAYAKSERDKWSRVIRDSNIRLD
jgi:tripartite-type tricarboxylate transporter receptor subunit TctC